MYAEEQLKFGPGGVTIPKGGIEIAGIFDSGDDVRLTALHMIRLEEGSDSLMPGTIKAVDAIILESVEG